MPPETCNHNDARICDNIIVCSSCGVVRCLIDRAPVVSQCGQVLHPPEISTIYQYRGLSRDRDEIRLVVILPGEGNHPVYCHIITAELDSIPQYVAVSYTWATEDGDCSKSREIYVKIESTVGQFTRRVQVTANCENTLRQLRDKCLERIVWIDGVCIDQSDIYERNHQVGLMERIYKSAAHVEVCIQDLGESYHGALELLRPEFQCGILGYGQDSAHRQLDHPRRFDNPARRTGFVFSHPRMNETYPWRTSVDQREAIRQLKALFERNYFGRVWVIQEVLFAKVAILRINQETVQFDQESLEYLHRWCDQRYITIPRLHHWSSIWKRDGGIISCLCMSLECEASDPRDKVFAITSLLRSNIRDMIAINYRSDLQAVYADAIAACVSECGDLDVLGFAKLTPNTNIFTTSTFCESNFKKFLAHRTLSKASVPSMTQMRHPWTSHIAIKHRTIRDDIHSGYTTPENSSAVEVLYDPIPSTQVLPRLRVRAHLIDISVGTTNGSIEQMLDKLHQDFEEIGASSWCWLLELFKSPSTNLQSGPYNASGLRTLSLDLEHAKPQPFDEKQVVFRTYYSVGFSGSFIHPGDEIFAIDGVRHLFILRNVGTSVYRIVGTCYLWGGMKLDYWNPGSYLGIWTHRPFDLGSERTRVIEIY